MEKNENKKSNKVLVVMLVIVTILLVGCVGYIIGSKDNKGEALEENNNEVVEKTSDDYALNLDIKDKIATLERLSNSNEVSDYRTGVIYSKNSKNEEFLVSQKLYVVLGKNFDQHRNNSPVTTNYDFGVGLDKSSLSQLEVSDIEREYKNLFGVAIQENQLQSFKEKCPMFIYDAPNKKYYAGAECGGTSPYTIQTYVNRITTKGDELYAYVSFAVSDYENSIIYTDYARTKQHSKVTTMPSQIINENNYKEFGEYKYTFKKENNNFYFVKIERLS